LGFDRSGGYRCSLQRISNNPKLIHPHPSTTQPPTDQPKPHSGDFHLVPSYGNEAALQASGTTSTTAATTSAAAGGTSGAAAALADAEARAAAAARMRRLEGLGEFMYFIVSPKVGWLAGLLGCCIRFGGGEGGFSGFLWQSEICCCWGVRRRTQVHHPTPNHYTQKPQPQPQPQPPQPQPPQPTGRTSSSAATATPRTASHGCWSTRALRTRWQ